MVARRSSEYKPIDTLIAAAKQLLRQLEEVKSAEAHDEHAHGRPRPRSTSSKRSTSRQDLAATFKAIVKEAQAKLAELGELETHKAEGHEPEEREAETQEWQTHKQDVSVLPSQEHVAGQIPTEQRMSERGIEGSNLRFPCRLSQLRENMVATIQQARKTLQRHDVDKRGYLILQVRHHWDTSELTQLLRGAPALGRDEIKGFALAQGDTDCLHAQVAADISLDLCDMEGFNAAGVSQQPKEEFEEWITSPPPTAFNI